MSFNISVKKGTNFITRYIGGQFYESYTDSTNYIESSDFKPDRVRSRKTTGWKYPKAYEREVTHTVGPQGFWMLESTPGDRFERTGDFSPIIGSFSYRRDKSYFDSDLANDALTKAMLSVKDESVNLGVSMFEAGKTASMVGTTATRLARGFTALRRGNMREVARQLGVSPGKAPRVARDVSRKWLEYQYGWKPLLGDIDGACKYLAELGDTGATITGKGFVQKDIRDHTTSGLGGEFPTDRTTTGREIAYVRLDFTPSNIPQLKAKAAGLLNPLSLAWELVPYSFVVDWFLPVGDFISCFDYAAGLSWRSGSLTEMWDHRSRVISTLPRDKHVVHWNVAGSSRHFKMKRTVYENMPLFAPLPHPRLGLNFKRMADGLALLNSAFSSNRPIR